METKKNRKLSSVIKDLAEGSSLHGIPKIASSRQLAVKVLWCLMFMSTFGFLMYQIFNLFSTYYSYPIQTTVSLDFSPLRFPAVSFCNMNPIKQSQLDQSPQLKEVINPKVKVATKKTTRRKRGASGSGSATSSSSEIQPSSVQTGALSTSISAASIAPSAALSSIITPSASLSASIAPSGSSGGSDSGSGSGDYTYSYSQDSWNWDTGYSGSGDTGASGDYNSGYYSSFYDTYSGSGLDNADQFTANQYILDQLLAPKDLWEQRIGNFKTHYRNESLYTRISMGHNKNDFILSATFASTIQNVSTFPNFSTPDYGNCYTISSLKYKAWRSGPDYGLKLTLNLEKDEYIANFATGYGVRMVLHEPGSLPLPAEEGMTLSPGFETSVGLRMVVVSRQGEPYGICSDGSDFMSLYGIKYSISACMQLCRVKYVMSMCSCYPSDAPDLDYHTDTMRICDSSAMVDKICSVKVDVMFDQGTLDCGCDNPCSETVYQKTMSGRRWPNDDYLENVLMRDVCNKNVSSMDDACNDIAHGNFSAATYRDNFLRVLIYFEDLNYETITQEPLYESVRFLSDVGGAMGLFMGASVLSFMEILQLLLEIGLWLKGRTGRIAAVPPPHGANMKPRESVFAERTLTTPPAPPAYADDPNFVTDFTTKEKLF